MKTLFVLGGGIGNIIQATPAIQAVASEGHQIDLMLHCNSSADYQIYKLPCVNNIFDKQRPPNKSYDVQLNGPFTPGARYQTKKVFKTRIYYAQHIEEAKVYYDLAVQMGVKTPMPDAKIAVGNWPKHNKDPDTIAMYPGSKHNWAMKRWDKYDQLALKFKKVVVLGTDKDIKSHADPTWIKKPWKWPKHVEFMTGGLQEIAYAILTCKAFIGNDGGLAHVAAATGIPTFVLFGPSSDVKNKPYSKNAHVVAIDLPCRPCQFQKGPDGKQIFGDNKANCPFGMKCMKEMTVDHVFNKVKRTLGDQNDA